VKGRLCQPPLPEPKIAFTGKQAIPEQALICLQHPAFDKLPRVIHKNVFNVIRVGNEVGTVMQKPQANDIPILARRAGKKFQRIAAERAEYAIKSARFRARRKSQEIRAPHLGMLIVANDDVNALSCARALNCVSADGTHANSSMTKVYANV
jgi:hypothetical protein